ncbi:alkaline phosphatase D family protein [Lolliginicoccus suaedae]|uniref:alkaline phosphatase D family protein n=1 Tax=Lolliginicoccus suaedae TaxID=2605429 RepID=UPI001CA91493|nr:alkaline phosphatase D family protein [Lolliginicoccus suaedae]
MTPVNAGSASIVLGPIVRYVNETEATIWVQTSVPCTVAVLCDGQECSAPTWTVHGRHYTLVRVTGLAPGRAHPYWVQLDESAVWPEQIEDAPSTIRTLPRATPGDSTARPVRIVFGSCYRTGGQDPASVKALGPDALVALARRMRDTPDEEWPDALCLLGDQVYADLPPQPLADTLPRGEDGLPRASTFDEYAALYEAAWSQPDVRWLLSAVPTCMILDDHDLRDDWNTSQSWRDEASVQPGWDTLVTGALSSYWVYQHLGNLSPVQLDEDAVLRAVLDAPTADERARILADMARRADSQPASMRWSFVRDIGPARLLMLDTRCSRSLEPGRRRLVDDAEWQWAREQVLGADARHILIGTSLPVLMLPGIHQLEGWNEAVCDGQWGQRWVDRGEKLRRKIDLEHWGAFRGSFLAMVDLVIAAATSPRPPVSLLWLSGDVHSSYIATASLDDHPGVPTAIHQLTMSPFRNPLPRGVRWAKKVLGSRLTAGALHSVARRARVDDVGMDWTIPHGPWFDNGVMTVELDDEHARAHIDHAPAGRDAQAVLRRTRSVSLA